jgi:Tfp pilus assembly protein PilV
MPGDVSLRPKRQIVAAGLTLIEFLIATSIMAFAALGVAGMFPAAFRSVIGGGQVTKATILAQEMADMIRTEPFDKVYVTPSSGNGYTGYSNQSASPSTFDTRNTGSLPATCPVPSTDSCTNKKKWQSDLLAGAGQASGKGLPVAYGTVAVTCLNIGTTSPYTPTTATCGGSTNLLRITVTVFWDRNASRSVNLVTYVARIE